MKSPPNLIPYLTVAILAVITVLCWPWQPENATPIPVELATTPSRSPDQLPQVTRNAQQNAVSVPPDPLANTLALVHLKLLQMSQTKTGDRDTQVRLLNELLAMLTDDNASEILQSLSAEERDTPFGIAALDHWLKVDPAKAANWVAACPDATESQAWAIARKLLKDPTGLQNFCSQLPDTKWKQTFLLDAGLEALSQNPNEVINLAQQMNPGSDQTNLLQTAVNAWMGSDPNATMNWIMNVDDPSLRDQLIAAGAKSYATTNPRQAATWLVSSMQPGQTFDETALNIVDSWSASNPADAASWVAGLPEGDMKNSAVTAVAGQWLKSDPRAATAWVQSLPEGNKILANLNQDRAQSPSSAH